MGGGMEQDRAIEVLMAAIRLTDWLLSEVNATDKTPTRFLLRESRCFYSKTDPPGPYQLIVSSEDVIAAAEALIGLSFVELLGPQWDIPF